MDVNQLLIKMIKNIDMFKSINEKEAEELAQNFELKFYGKGSKIINQGKKPTCIYILKDGELEARSDYKRLGSIDEGEVFGEMSAIDKKPAMADVVAIKDSNVWQVSRKKFVEFINKYSDIKEKVNSVMEKRKEKNQSN